MGIPKLLAAFAGHVSKIRRVGSNFCRKLRGSSMPTIDASSTAGTVGQKKGWEDDEHNSGE